MPLSTRYAAMGEYSRSPVVRDRLFGGMTAWAAGQVSQPIPPNPDDRWIRLRIMAERVPQQTDAYVVRVAPYVLQTSDIIDHLADHLAPYLEDERADAVETQISAAIQTVMPRVAAAEVQQPQVEQWRKDNGFPAKNGA